MSMITKLINRLRKAADFRHTIGDYMTAGLHREAADTIETYQKAFEDIREELENSQPEPDYNAVYNMGYFEAMKEAVNIVSKHDPDKAESEVNKE